MVNKAIVYVVFEYLAMFLLMYNRSVAPWASPCSYDIYVLYSGSNGDTTLSGGWSFLVEPEQSL